MTLEEALAVYLYLRNTVVGDRERRLTTKAWDVIARRAEKVIREQYPLDK